MTKPQTIATNKYHAKAYDRYTLLLYKGEKELLQNYCREHGFSLNSLVRDLLKASLPSDLFLR